MRIIANDVRPDDQGNDDIIQRDRIAVNVSYPFLTPCLSQTQTPFIVRAGFLSNNQPLTIPPRRPTMEEDPLAYHKSVLEEEMLARRLRQAGDLRRVSQSREQLIKEFANVSEGWGYRSTINAILTGVS